MAITHVRYSGQHNIVPVTSIFMTQVVFLSEPLLEPNRVTSSADPAAITWTRTLSHRNTFYMEYDLHLSM